MAKHPLLIDLRNAYEAKDRDAFDSALRRLEPLLPYAAHTQLAPCARGAACICPTLSERARCSYVSAQPRGTL